MGSLYLLHFEPRFRHARHYLGFTSRAQVSARIDEHEQGRGAHLTAAAVAAGCELFVAAIAAGDRRQERRIKRMSRLGAYCPICCARLGRPVRPLDQVIPRQCGGNHRRQQSA